MPNFHREQAKLTYPKHLLQSTDLLHFIYEDGFVQDFADLGLGEDDINLVEVMIMAGAKDSPVIQGTGGLRKMRFAPESWKVGKSGGARVLFVYFDEIWTVLMIAAYRKSQYDNISGKAKAIYSAMIHEAKREIARRGRLC